VSADAPRVTRYTWGSGLHDQVHAEERIKSDGTRHWRVGLERECWTRDRCGLVWEPSPSSRDDEWFKMARWTMEEAMEEGPKALAHLRSLRAHHLQGGSHG
jgi:hypothetical protein